MCYAHHNILSFATFFLVTCLTLAENTVPTALGSPTPTRGQGNDTSRVSTAPSDGLPILSETASVEETALSVERSNCFRKVSMHESTNFTCNRSLLVHLSLTEFWTEYASERMCIDRGKYGGAMECILKATKGCLPPENQRHFPDAADVRDGLVYICNIAKQSSDIDISCARRHFSRVFDCLKRDTLTAVRKEYLRIPIKPQHICRTYDIADLCLWEKLQVCGQSTAGAYVRLMSVYLRPPTCRSSGQRIATSSFWLTTLASTIGVLCTAFCRLLDI